MSENPYAAPETSLPQAAGVVSGEFTDLLGVAKTQKAILVCILIKFALIFLMFIAPRVGPEAGPSTLAQLGSGLFLLVGLVAAVFAFSLAIKVYGTGLGIFWGIMSLIPCLGLLVLLLINSKATSTLQLNGFKVGLMGANVAEVERRVYEITR